MDTLLVLGHFSYGNPFDSLFKRSYHCTYYSTPENSPYSKNAIPSMILFTGGSDISPSLYNEPNIASGYSDPKRDAGEVSWFNWAVENKIPMFGTCRGMQLFTAMTGGRLIQDVDNHIGTHKVEFKDGKKFTVNSIHHQMCVPPKGSELLAWSEGVSSRKIGSQEALAELPGDLEPEAIYFPKINALGVQWHPEGLGIQHPSNVYVRNLIKERLYA